MAEAGVVRFSLQLCSLLPLVSAKWLFSPHANTGVHAQTHAYTHCPHLAFFLAVQPGCSAADAEVQPTKTTATPSGMSMQWQLTSIRESCKRKSPCSQHTRPYTLIPKPYAVHAARAGGKPKTPNRAYSKSNIQFHLSLPPVHPRGNTMITATERDVCVCVCVCVYVRARVRVCAVTPSVLPRHAMFVCMCVCARARSRAHAATPSVLPRHIVISSALCSLARDGRHPARHCRKLLCRHGIITP